MSPTKERVLRDENTSVTVARQAVARAQDAASLAQRAAARYPLAQDHAQRAAASRAADDSLNAANAQLTAALIERERVVAMWAGVE